MAYAVEFVEDAGYVSTTLKSDVTIDELNAARAESASLLAEKDCTRLMVDASTVAHMQSIFDDYTFTAEHRKILPPPIRTAIVVRQDHRDHMQFVENVAQNRGVSLMLFLEREEALRWLFDP